MSLTLKQKTLKFFGPALFPLVRIYWRIFKPSIYGAKVIVQNDDKFLIIKNSYGFRAHTFPGGKTEKGESEIDTAIREVKEEVGLDIKNVRKIFDILDTRHGIKDHVAIFHAISDSTDLKLCEFEIEEGEWFDKNEVPELGPSSQDIWERFCSEE